MKYSFKSHIYNQEKTEAYKSKDAKKNQTLYTHEKESEKKV